MQGELALSVSAVAETGAYIIYNPGKYSIYALKPSMKWIRHFDRTWR